MGAVFDAMAHALFVELPDSPEFSPTRKLASFFGFKQVSATTFLLLKSEYGRAKYENETTTTQTEATDYSRAFKSSNITPEGQSLAEWTPDQRLFSAN
jgi:hypothetical protein